MKLSAAKLERLIEEATVDAYGESEQRVGFFTMIEENLACPFVTRILDIEVTVERIDMSTGEEIVAICRRGRTRQAIPILELPLPWPRQEGRSGSKRIAAGQREDEREPWANTNNRRSRRGCARSPVPFAHLPIFCGLTVI